MTKKLNKTNFCKLMVWFQDYGDVQSNAAATAALKEFGVSQRLHQKITGNSDSAYYQKAIINGK